MHTDVINAFVAKLKLWSQRANNDNFASFHHLTEITGDDFEQNLKKDIISHLQNLQNEFERYFFEINTFSILMKVAKNPFLCKVEDVSEAIQEEFIELTNDSFEKDEFHTCNLEEFWVKIQRCYPRLGIHALNILFRFLQHICASASCLLSNLKHETHLTLNLTFVAHYLLLHLTLNSSLPKNKGSRYNK